MADDSPLVPLHRINRSQTFALLIKYLTQQELEMLLVEPPHRHDLHEIFLVTHGSSEQMIDDHHHNFSMNNLGLLAKGQIHHVLTMRDFKIWAVFFDRDMLTEKLQALSLSLFHFRSKHQFFLTATERELLESLFRAMVTIQADNSNTYAQADLLQHYLGTVLWHIERINHHDYQKTQTNQPAHYGSCQMFLGLLEKYFHKEHSVQFYADTLQLSRRRLSDMTKVTLGQRAKDIIEERLNLEARRLIRYSELNIQEIGYRLGFDDPSYFARFFKRHNNCSPLTFRELST